MAKTSVVGPHEAENGRPNGIFSARNEFRPHETKVGPHGRLKRLHETDFRRTN
jgi:hypothetical protein